MSNHRNKFLRGTKSYLRSLGYGFNGDEHDSEVSLKRAHDVIRDLGALRQGIIQQLRAHNIEVSDDVTHKTLLRLIAKHGLKAEP